MMLWQFIHSSKPFFPFDQRTRSHVRLLRCMFLTGTVSVIFIVIDSFYRFVKTEIIKFQNKWTRAPNRINCISLGVFHEHEKSVRWVCPPKTFSFQSLQLKCTVWAQHYPWSSPYSEREPNTSKKIVVKMRHLAEDMDAAARKGIYKISVFYSDAYTVDLTARVCVCVFRWHTSDTAMWWEALSNKRPTGQLETVFLYGCSVKTPQELFTRCFYRISRRNQQRKTEREKKTDKNEKLHALNATSTSVVVFMAHPKKKENANNKKKNSAYSKWYFYFLYESVGFGTAPRTLSHGCDAKDMNNRKPKYILRTRKRQQTKWTILAK